jgi:segregation and condensation protein A
LFLERSWSSEAELRSMLVVTLMSILELVRMGVASVHQPLDAQTIVVERVAGEAEAREALRGYDESRSFGDGTRPPPPDPAQQQQLPDAAEQEPSSSPDPAQPQEPLDAAGVAGRSIVSEALVIEASSTGLDPVAPRPADAGDAMESSEDDGQEHGQTGKAEAIEGP